MRAVSPGRAAVQDMVTDRARFYVAMAEKFLDRADTLATPSGCVANKWPLWPTIGSSARLPETSDFAARIEILEVPEPVRSTCAVSWPSSLFRRPFAAGAGV